MNALGRLSHICFDIENIAQSVKLFSGLLGAPRPEIKTLTLDNGEGEVKTAFFHLKGGCIELAEHHLPASWGASPLLTGHGFHHIAFEVTRFDETLKMLEKRGIRPLPRFPMTTPHGRVAFLDPRQTGGILWELAEKEEHGGESNSD
jgi:catechol 2,3-dioxygenase-like lactoylglutathione lyase family enzyme